MKPAAAVTRREFVRTAAGAAALFTAPLIVPSRLFGANAPSNRIRVGHIGCGRIATVHDMPGVFKAGLADSVAVCDLDSKRLAAGKALVEKLYADAGQAAPTVATYGNYQELLAQADIDAVTISLPDHQHAEVALRAIRAGKDVYLQKPFTMTHAESVVLRDAVAKSSRIMQIGSQQRSWDPHEQFRRACEFVRSGRVGRLKAVEIGLPIDPTKPDDPQQPVPPNLNYDLWLGPTPEVYYTEQRVHSQTDVTSRPGWLRNESYCLGMITGWGAHHFDSAHWGMDQEYGGPIQIEGQGEFPTNSIWNVHGKYNVHLTYPGGVQMRVSDQLQNGIKFIGDEGWIFVARNEGATASDPKSNTPGQLHWLAASDPKLLDPEGVKVKFPASTSHHKNWLECVKSRATPLSPAAMAHHSNTACILSWIAMKTGRPLTWDGKAGRFVGDEAANAMLTRPERAGYGALRLSGMA
ncbi:MAG TPA: Gfo/Idh/MocA family oxidoreductase [Lacunisphaera sp.]|nr:Gfo/Idh/MocA family oxidoreductase [Lacunisphaera sp.]